MKKKIAIKNVYTVIFPALFVSILTILNLNGSIKEIGLMAVIILFLIGNLDAKIVLLFFFTSFSADFNTFYFGIPFYTILQILFVINVLKEKEWVMDKTYLISVILILGLQMYSIFCCNESFVKIITFILNLLLLYCISKIRITALLEKKIYIAFVIGLLIALIAGITRTSNFQIESYVRFKGIWTDPNFLGMFCIIAIIFLFKLIKNRKIAIFFSVPVFSFLAYCGYRTYSKTFILVIILVIGIIGINVLASSSSPISKIFLFTLIVLGIFFIYTNYVTAIVSLRGNIYSTSGDWTNGRFNDTIILLSKWSEKIGTILFGIGVNNSFSYAAVAHNTYAELLGQFGIIGAVVLIINYITILRKNNVSLGAIKKSETIYIIVILIYASVLSLESTDLIYCLLGLSIAEWNETKIKKLNVINY